MIARERFSAINEEGNTISTFHFLLENAVLCPLWEKFSQPSSLGWTYQLYCIVLCKKHFEETFIKRGKQRNRLLWEPKSCELNPVSTHHHSEEAQKIPSSCATPSEPR